MSLKIGIGGELGDGKIICLSGNVGMDGHIFYQK